MLLYLGLVWLFLAYRLNDIMGECPGLHVVRGIIMWMPLLTRFPVDKFALNLKPIHMFKCLHMFIGNNS